MRKVLFIVAFVVTFICSCAALGAQYLVSWQPNPSADSVLTYYLYHSITPDTLTATLLDTVSAGEPLAVFVTDINEGTRHYFWIKARNAEEFSMFSNSVSGMTIPEGAEDLIKDLCKIANIDKIRKGEYDVSWSNTDNLWGFLQYGIDTLTEMTPKDTTDFAYVHTERIIDLEVPADYLIRAVGYDGSKNMTVSTIEEFRTTYRLIPPGLKIFPVPYHPSMGPLTILDIPEGGELRVCRGSRTLWVGYPDDNGQVVWNGETTWSAMRLRPGVYDLVGYDADGEVIGTLRVKYKL